MNEDTPKIEFVGTPYVIDRIQHFAELFILSGCMGVIAVRQTSVGNLWVYHKGQYSDGIVGGVLSRMYNAEWRAIVAAAFREKVETWDY